MPIYAYRCASCGHSRDVLQKMSDPVLTTCPACGAEQFQKQVTAAGFQLKGSGWYATDFKGGNSAPATDAKNDGKSDGKSDGKTDGKSETKTDGKSDTKTEVKTGSKPADSTPSPAKSDAAPSASAGRGGVCH